MCYTNSQVPEETLQLIRHLSNESNVSRKSYSSFLSDSSSSGYPLHIFYLLQSFSPLALPQIPQFLQSRIIIFLLHLFLSCPPISTSFSLILSTFSTKLLQQELRKQDYSYRAGREVSTRDISLGWGEEHNRFFYSLHRGTSRDCNYINLSTHLYL